MNELDADDEKLKVEDRIAERDIVQFVPLKKFLTEDGPNDKPQADLAEEVLAEIPEQFTSYMKSRGFEPQDNPDIPTDTLWSKKPEEATS